MCSPQAFELHTLTGADVVVGVVMNGHVRVYSSRQDLYEAVSTACASSALSAEQTYQQQQHYRALQQLLLLAHMHPELSRSFIY